MLPSWGARISSQLFGRRGGDALNAPTFNTRTTVVNVPVDVRATTYRSDQRLRWRDAAHASPLQSVERSMTKAPGSEHLRFAPETCVLR